MLCTPCSAEKMNVQPLEEVRLKKKPHSLGIRRNDDFLNMSHFISIVRDKSQEACAKRPLTSEGDAGFRDAQLHCSDYNP